MNNVTLRIHRMYDDVVMPSFETSWSSCFDLRAYLKDGDKIKHWDKFNHALDITVTDESFVLHPGCRALIPTGLIFDLSASQSIRVHPRSGVSIKTGIILANCEGVVDADYVEQTFLPMYNMSMKSFVVEHNGRYVQAELYYRGYNGINFDDVGRPAQKTDRSGGFGSTGSS